MPRRVRGLISMKAPDPELEAFASARYQAMRHRLRAKYDKQGRCYRPELPLPFSRQEFQNWCAGVFRQGIAKCFYCEWPISLETTHFDHRTPIVQGGSAELWNLVPTCEACNQLKGALTEDGFHELKELLNRLSPTDAADIRGRLQSQLKLALWKQKRIRDDHVPVQIVPHQRNAG